MSNSSKILKGIGILAAVVAVGVLIGYWASSSGTPRTSTPNAPSAPSNPTTEQPVARPIKEPAKDPGAHKTPTVVQKPRQNPNPTTPPTLNVTPQPTVPQTVGTNLVPDWEEKVDAILTSDDPDPEKAKKMLAMFPLLTGEAQEELAHHLSNLTPDEDYAAFGSNLTNSTLSEDVLDVLLEDVLNRPNSIKLPMLLEVARDPQNPKSAEAKDVLELFLEEDYGADWAKWESKTKEWLKDNPD